ncbi:MAG: hypothetical protein Q8L48_44285 [Archangium sp.]|nr:hypothetical protein [Archangium sp.]
MRSITIALCFLASASFAQGKNEPRAKPQIVEFQPADVIGKGEVPVGAYYGIPPKPKFKRMIRVRLNFNDKLAESVHEM